MAYEETGEDAVLPWEVSDTVRRGHGLHDVSQGEEARGLHGEPGEAAGDIETAGDGGLAHAVPAHEPLDVPELSCQWSFEEDA